MWGRGITPLWIVDEDSRAPQARNKILSKISDSRLPRYWKGERGEDLRREASAACSIKKEEAIGL
jgi:hypothetical protein